MLPPRSEHQTTEEACPGQPSSTGPQMLGLVAGADVSSPQHLAHAPGATKGSAAKGLLLAPNGRHGQPKADSVLAPPCWGSPLPARHGRSFSAQTLPQGVSSPAGWVVVTPSCRAAVAPCREPLGVAGAGRRQLPPQAAQD